MQAHLLIYMRFYIYFDEYMLFLYFLNTIRTLDKNIIG